MHDIESEAEARSLSDGDFYRHLVARNRGLVSEESQQAIASTKLLVAGCGSIGGASVEPLARIGFRDFHLADIGVFELNNLNRQRAHLNDLGRNKASVAGRTIEAINPHATVAVTTEGITKENVDALVRYADIIVDGVDVTTPSGLAAKVALHEAALAHRRPLVTGWDLAGVLCAEYIDYRVVDRIFNGAITSGDLETLSVWEAIVRIAPMSKMPGEMLDELARNLRDPLYSVPQLPEAAWQFGSLACHIVAQVAAGNSVPTRTCVDVHALTQPRWQRARNQLQLPLQFVRFGLALGLKSTLRATAPRPLLAFL